MNTLMLAEFSLFVQQTVSETMSMKFDKKEN